MKNMKRIIGGVFLVALGIILAINALGITDINIFFDGWWTLIIIIPAIGGIIFERDKTYSVIGLVIGIALLLSARGILDFSKVFKLAVPAILIVIGTSVIIKNLRQKSKSLRESPSTPKKEYYVLFSGQDINFDGQVFDGAELSACFGGIDCDLRNAIFENDAEINVSAVFGGITVFVPDGINVKVKSSALFGGIDNKKKAPDTEGAKTLYINAESVFGGVDIK